MNSMKKIRYFLLFTYSMVLLSVLAIGYRIVIALISLWATGDFAYSWSEVPRGLRMAAIASFAITVAAFIFNKLDEQKARKDPPSDPKS